ncbi:transposase [Lachnoclostridium sp.]|uniref:transposase n=1 Tax=Lachnoclostridium sp. TaxID=2028282 RepID=UPI002F3F198C
MAKSPHTPEFRAKVSQEYLDGLGSYDYLSTKYNIGSKTLKQWVAKYRFYGIAAFATKSGNTSYSSDFKTICVEAVLSGEGSVDDIVAKHNISSREVLRRWIKVIMPIENLRIMILRGRSIWQMQDEKQPLRNVKKS